MPYFFYNNSLNYSNILVCLDNILYIFSSKPFIFLITTQKHMKKNFIWSALCILYNNFGSLLCASNSFHPHLCGKFYILKWYNCYWNIFLVWQFWVRSNIEKHTLSTYIFRILFFFFFFFFFNLCYYGNFLNATSSSQRKLRESEWFFFISIFFLLFASLENFRKQNSFSFLSLIFY